MLQGKAKERIKQGIEEGRRGEGRIEWEHVYHCSPMKAILVPKGDVNMCS
jgi:hypothetical protein